MANLKRPFGTIDLHINDVCETYLFRSNAAKAVDSLSWIHSLAKIHSVNAIALNESYGPLRSSMDPSLTLECGSWRGGTNYLPETIDGRELPPGWEPGPRGEDPPRTLSGARVRAGPGGGFWRGGPKRVPGTPKSGNPGIPEIRVLGPPDLLRGTVSSGISESSLHRKPSRSLCSLRILLVQLNGFPRHFKENTGELPITGLR